MNLQRSESFPGGLQPTCNSPSQPTLEWQHSRIVPSAASSHLDLCLLIWPELISSRQCCGQQHGARLNCELPDDRTG